MVKAINNAVCCLTLMVAIYAFVLTIMGAWFEEKKYFKYARYFWLSLPVLISLNVFFVVWEG